MKADIRSVRTRDGAMRIVLDVIEYSDDEHAELNKGGVTPLLLNTTDPERGGDLADDIERYIADEIEHYDDAIGTITGANKRLLKHAACIAKLIRGEV